MRTNIVIDPDLLDAAMKAGPYTTKKDAVEAGLKLLARQAAYREILKWEGKLHWEGDESVDWTQPAAPEVIPVSTSGAAPIGSAPNDAPALLAAQPATPYAVKRAPRGRR